MIGPGGIVRLVVARLTAAVPAVLGGYRARDGLDEWQCPDPWIHGDWPPQTVGLDLMPSLWTTEVSMNTVTGAYRNDPDPAGATWAFRYRMAVDGYVHSATEAEVADQRRYLVTAVREAMLAAPGLTDVTGPEFYVAAVQPLNWVERYSNVGSINDDLVAGFTCEFDVDTQEVAVAVPPPVGVMDGYGVHIINVPVPVPMDNAG